MGDPPTHATATGPLPGIGVLEALFAAGLASRQSPQKSVLDISSSIDNRKHEHNSAVASIEEPPGREDHFSVAVDALALEFRYNASGPWLSRKLLHGSIHTPNKVCRSTRRILRDVHGDIREVLDRRGRPTYRAHRSSMARNAALIASSWDTVAPVSTSCSPCASSFRIPIASINSW